MAKPKIQPALRLVENGVSLDEIGSLIEGGASHYLMNVPVNAKLAAFLLKFNTPGVSNRRLRRQGIESGARTLLAGEWVNTGEPLIISDSNLMNDGQHRLHAVIEADKVNPGITALMDIRFGIPRHHFAETNSGMKRSGADALELLGTGNATRLAAVARMVLCYEDGLPGSIRLARGNGEIVAAVERWPDMADSIRFTEGLPAGLKNASTGALGFFALRTANEASVAEFFRIMRTGEGDPSNPPHLLQRTLLTNRKGLDRDERVRLLALCIVAWNTWLAGGRLSRLTWNKDRFPSVNGLVL